MRFEIKSPWTQWLVDTRIKGRLWTAKVDGGSALTLIGVNIAALLGITEDYVISCSHVEYFDVSNATKHRAFRVPLGNIELPFGRKSFCISNIFIPFRVLTHEEISRLDKTTRSNNKQKVEFILRDKFLVGTDLLRQFQLHLTFEQELANGGKTTQWLELNEHKLPIPRISFREYSFKYHLQVIDEIKSIELDSLK